MGLKPSVRLGVETGGAADLMTEGPGAGLLGPVEPLALAIPGVDAEDLAGSARGEETGGDVDALRPGVVAGVGVFATDD